MALLNEIHLNSDRNRIWGYLSRDYGVFGDDNYWFMWRALVSDAFLRAYNYSGALLWERKIFSGDDDHSCLGTGLICNNRIYFYNFGENKVGWFAFTGDPPSDYPTFTPILTKGTNVDDLQGIDSFQWWSVTVYQNQYLFHCDTGANRILVTDLDGNYKGHFGTYGSLTGQFYHPVQCVFYDSYLFVAEEGNRRVSVWKLNSVNPFDIVPLNSAGISGLSEDEEPRGIGVCKQLGQVYIICKDRKVREYKINSNLSLTFSGNYFEVDSNTARQGGRGIVVTNNQVVATAHEWPFPYGGDIYPQHSILVHTAIENHMYADAGFDCYGLSLGVNNPISFDIRAGQQGMWKDLLLSFIGEGYIQNNRINGFLGFSMQAKHDIYACIASLSFNMFAGQNDLRKELQFSILAEHNYMMSVLDFDIETNTFANEFSEAENELTFEMVASTPLSASVKVELELIQTSCEALTDRQADMGLYLNSLEAHILEAGKAILKLSLPVIDSTLLLPVVATCDLRLSLDANGQLEIPFSLIGVLETESLTTSGLAYQPGASTVDIDLPSIDTNGIAYCGSDSGEMSILLPIMELSSSLIVLPTISCKIALPSLLLEAVELKDIASINDIYQNGSLILASGTYPQVEGVEFQGVIINTATKAVSRIANTEYFIIDLGNIDLHKKVVNHYLEVFITGYTDQPDQSIGELIAGNYTYEIEPWITGEEWRVVIGKGITRRTAQNVDNRYLNIKLKLKNNFELKSITIFATPTRRRR